VQVLEYKHLYHIIIYRTILLLIARLWAGTNGSAAGKENSCSGGAVHEPSPIYDTSLSILVGRMWTLEDAGEPERLIRILWIIQEIRMTCLSFVCHRSMRMNKDMQGN